ncbi:tubulin-specific chaperone C-like [Saccostrea cucullata]|uniref:tubulin-specific chaperone C-like n=1 Tax=Saccostrea cuccullata TaxID=36930 RepID=UPI002ED42697
MDTLLEKKTEVTERLKRREVERLAELQKRKQEKENNISTLEGTKYFIENFNKEKSDILLALEQVDTRPKNEMVTELDRISERIQGLQKFHADSTMFLPSYDVRQSQETLGNLHTLIQEKRDKLFPKKKFAFSSKKKTVKQDENKKEEEVKTNASKNEDQNVQLADCTIQKKSKECVEMSEAAMEKKDVSLFDNSFCTIKLFGAPSTVHMKNLTDCIVITGPVSSSIFISDCKNCTFVIACQQLRTHSTTKCKFYLHVTSRAIIEDCSELEFAPYSLSYSKLDDHFVTAGLDKSKNNWHDVDDFNWLAHDVHSPNWNIMSEEKREQFKF